MLSQTYVIMSSERGESGMTISPQVTMRRSIPVTLLGGARWRSWITSSANGWDVCLTVSAIGESTASPRDRRRDISDGAWGKTPLETRIGFCRQISMRASPQRSASSPESTQVIPDVWRSCLRRLLNAADRDCHVLMAKIDSRRIQYYAADPQYIIIASPSC